MDIYCDSSFLIALYCLDESESLRAASWLSRFQTPIPYTPFHRHEIRTGIRSKLARREITVSEQQEAFREIESDLEAGILIHTPIPWTEAFREADITGELFGGSMSLRSLDLLHIGIARALKSANFLTFDERQKRAAIAAGLHVPQI